MDAEKHKYQLQQWSGLIQERINSGKTIKLLLIFCVGPKLIFPVILRLLKRLTLMNELKLGPAPDPGIYRFCFLSGVW